MASRFSQNASRFISDTVAEIRALEGGAAGGSVPSGGTTGQVLAKSSAVDYATTWVNQASANPFDQDLNTTDSATFNNLTLTGDLSCGKIQSAPSATTYFQLLGNEFHFYAAGSSRIMLGTTGNVGINTISPDANLDVNGDLMVSGQSDLHVYSDLDSPTGNFERMSLSVDANGDATIATSSGGTGDDGDLILEPASDVLVSPASGRVAINTDPLGLWGLTVGGDYPMVIKDGTQVRYEFYHNAFHLKYGTPITSYYANLRLGVEGEVDSLNIEQGTGNVGINTTSPSAKLDVNGDARFRARIIRSKSVYTGTDTTDDVALHVCDSATAFTLTVTDGADDGEEIKIVNRGAGAVTLSGKINTTTAVASLASGETIVLNWDATDDEWQ